ncbi:MAG: hypothetical protein DMG54_22530 [Acidobacteria bacterium]|nr:MAG: hypothetical protein DMG54_22530 [Acidobacteriota bacterium]PYU45905.1 MAG: hypothetical protein DMG53_13285 [Acidobacteriota bacterium]PYU77376.1 MAG: hypothetical protein DMG52_00620 [Acidobacteriota bacterium]
MFRAAAKGRDLQLDNAGVIGGNEVFQDRETGSQWQQSSLQAISGPLKGEHLELYPFLLTDWGEWHRLHPDTLVLKPLPGYADRIAERNEMIRQGLSGEGSAPPGVLRVDDRLKPKTMVLGLVVGGSDEAFPLTVLRQAHIINEEIGGQPVLVVHQPTSDTTTAFIARVKGTRLKFRAANADATELIDVQTKSRWNPYGDCISGAFKGSQLTSVILEPEYWFAWSEFHPDTKIYVATEPKPQAGPGMVN